MFQQFVAEELDHKIKDNFGDGDAEEKISKVLKKHEIYDFECSTEYTSDRLTYIVPYESSSKMPGLLKSLEND
jgi:hypothetical protein